MWTNFISPNAGSFGALGGVIQAEEAFAVSRFVLVREHRRIRHSSASAALSAIQPRAHCTLYRLLSRAKLPEVRSGSLSRFKPSRLIHTLSSLLIIHHSSLFYHSRLFLASLSNRGTGSMKKFKARVCFVIGQGFNYAFMYYWIAIL